MVITMKEIKKKYFVYQNENDPEENVKDRGWIKSNFSP
jgi:hypothetical protein